MDTEIFLKDLKKCFRVLHESGVFISLVVINANEGDSSLHLNALCDRYAQ